MKVQLTKILPMKKKIFVSIEIPKPRWSAYDAKRFGIKPLPGTTLKFQERACTSPIWYTPGT